MISLKGKTILITGASSGIGRQCAIDASNIGANIILIGRSQERLNQTHRRMKEGNHIIFAQDITEYDKLGDIVSQAAEKLGKVSGFIHSAGVEETIPLRDMIIEKYQEIFAVNVFSGLELAKVLSKKKYLADNGASFVFLSSVMGIVGQSGKIAYCSSKSALVSAAKAMALELSSKKIRVNCVLPGVVMTEMTEKLFSKMNEETKDAVIKMHPLGLGKPEDISNLCMFLLSDLSKWITGSALVVDGGYSAA